MKILKLSHDCKARFAPSCLHGGSATGKTMELPLEILVTGYPWMDRDQTGGHLDRKVRRQNGL